MVASITQPKAGFAVAKMTILGAGGADAKERTS